MRVGGRSRKVALGVAIPALAICAFGAVSLFDAIFLPWACGIVCASPPWRSLEPSLVILGVGGAMFALTVLIEPRIFEGRRFLVRSGLLILVLGSVVLEGSAASLFADFGFRWYGDLYDLFAVLLILTFDILGFSLLVVGARHWWIAKEPTSRSADASTSVRGTVSIEGVTLLALGSAGAILDVVFAGCVGSGPCRPNPLVPLVFPLLVFAVGASLFMIVEWKPLAVTR